jgi:hypothetical protein
MRYALALLALFVAGCKTVEVVEVTVDYPLAAVHVAAKFEARDDVPREVARLAQRDDESLRK